MLACLRKRLSGKRETPSWNASVSGISESELALGKTGNGAPIGTSIGIGWKRVRLVAVGFVRSVRDSVSSKSRGSVELQIRVYRGTIAKIGAQFGSSTVGFSSFAAETVAAEQTELNSVSCAVCSVDRCFAGPEHFFLTCVQRCCGTRRQISHRMGA